MSPALVWAFFGFTCNKTVVSCACIGKSYHWVQVIDLTACPGIT